MSQTDVSQITEAVGGLQIDGPTHVHNPRPTFLDEPQAATVEPPLEDDEVDLGDDGDDVGEIDLDAGAAPEDKALFDSSAYLAVPTIDGQGADTLKFVFSGTIEYDAKDPAGRDLYDRMMLGRSVEMHVSGVVAKKSGAWRLKADDTEVVTGAVGVKVDTLYLPAPEEL